MLKYISLIIFVFIVMFIVKEASTNVGYWRGYKDAYYMNQTEMCE